MKIHRGARPFAGEQLHVHEGSLAIRPYHVLTRIEDRNLSCQVEVRLLAQPHTFFSPLTDIWTMLRTTFFARNWLRITNICLSSMAISCLLNTAGQEKQIGMMGEWNWLTWELEGGMPRGLIAWSNRLTQGLNTSCHLQSVLNGLGLIICITRCNSLLIHSTKPVSFNCLAVNWKTRENWQGRFHQCWAQSDFWTQAWAWFQQQSDHCGKLRCLSQAGCLHKSVKQHGKTLSVNLNWLFAFEKTNTFGWISQLENTA